MSVWVMCMLSSIVPDGTVFEDIFVLALFSGLVRADCVSMVCCRAGKYSVDAGAMPERMGYIKVFLCMSTFCAELKNSLVIKTGEFLRIGFGKT